MYWFLYTLEPGRWAYYRGSVEHIFYVGVCMRVSLYADVSIDLKDLRQHLLVGSGVPVLLVFRDVLQRLQGLQHLMPEAIVLELVSLKDALDR